MGDAVEGTLEVDVSNGRVMVVFDRESPVVERFKKVSGSGVLFEKAVLMWGNEMITRKEV